MPIPVTKAAPVVSDAIQSRHSIRDYESTPVPREILDRILKRALRAPSWKNTQPWEIHVVQGSPREAMITALRDAALSGKPPNPDSPFPTGFGSTIRKRMFELGKVVYEAAGIEREDKEARDEFALRNFEFFNAPVGLFFFTPVEPQFWTALDIGCMLGYVMLLAREEGLGTCAQGALASFPEIVRAQLGIPETQRLVCGMSMGYAKATKLNELHTPRESAESLIRYHE